jgi:NADH:ubiquinone oxidoreductase subunit E
MIIMDELLERARQASDEVAAASHRIHICVAAGCVSTGSMDVLEAFKQETERRELGADCLIKGVGCMGSVYVP